MLRKIACCSTGNTYSAVQRNVIKPTEYHATVSVEDSPAAVQPRATADHEPLLSGGDVRLVGLL